MASCACRRGPALQATGERGTLQQGSGPGAGDAEYRPPAAHVATGTRSPELGPPLIPPARRGPLVLAPRQQHVPAVPGAVAFLPLFLLIPFPCRSAARLLGRTREPVPGARASPARVPCRRAVSAEQGPPCAASLCCGKARPARSGTLGSRVLPAPRGARCRVGSWRQRAATPPQSMSPPHRPPRCRSRSAHAERAGFSRGCAGAGGLGTAGVTLLTNRLPVPPSPPRSRCRGGSRSWRQPLPRSPAQPRCPPEDSSAPDRILQAGNPGNGAGFPHPGVPLGSGGAGRAAGAAPSRVGWPLVISTSACSRVSLGVDLLC